MVIRITILIRRKEDLTKEKFLEHWTKEHVKIFSNVKKVQEKVIRYNQFHILKPESDKLSAAGFPVLDFDAAAEFFVAKLDDLMELLRDEEYQQKVTADESNFLDHSSIQVLVGEDHIQYEKI
ncbi:EthD domain-containing protein [Lentinula edodes]|nr:EthD domain-containing protein [Lentinula edodes]